MIEIRKCFARFKHARVYRYPHFVMESSRGFTPWQHSASFGQSLSFRIRSWGFPNRVRVRLRGITSSPCTLVHFGRTLVSSVNRHESLSRFRNQCCSLTQGFTYYFTYRTAYCSVHILLSRESIADYSLPPFLMRQKYFLSSLFLFWQKVSTVKIVTNFLYIIR